MEKFFVWKSRHYPIEDVKTMFVDSKKDKFCPEVQTLLREQGLTENDSLNVPILWKRYFVEKGVPQADIDKHLAHLEKALTRSVGELVSNHSQEAVDSLAPFDRQQLRLWPIVFVLLPILSALQTRPYLRRLIFPAKNTQQTPTRFKCFEQENLFDVSEPGLRVLIGAGVLSTFYLTIDINYRIFCKYFMHPHMRLEMNTGAFVRIELLKEE